jgi:ABC-type glycerol-3-phosphate transport system permease component
MARHALLVIVCLAALYPLWFIVSTALKTNAAYQADPTGLPTHPTLGELRSIVADQPLPRWMWNSFLVTLSSVAVSTLVALLAAYGAVFGRFRGHRIFLSTSVALMVVPPVTLLVPMFVFMVDSGWVNHLQSVIIFYTGLLVPFGVFFLTNFFRTVPKELIEAASVEGAGPFTVLRRGAVQGTVERLAPEPVCQRLEPLPRGLVQAGTRLQQPPPATTTRIVLMRMRRSSARLQRWIYSRSSRVLV